MGGHNPYFNRWFSAIGNEAIINEFINMVTILILIDGFLQFIMIIIILIIRKSQSLF